MNEEQLIKIAELDRLYKACRAIYRVKQAELSWADTDEIKVNPLTGSGDQYAFLRKNTDGSLNWAYTRDKALAKNIMQYQMDNDPRIAEAYTRIGYDHASGPAKYDKTSFSNFDRALGAGKYFDPYTAPVGGGGTTPPRRVHTTRTGKALADLGDTLGAGIHKGTSFTGGVIDRVTSAPFRHMNYNLKGLFGKSPVLRNKARWGTVAGLGLGALGGYYGYQGGKRLADWMFGTTNGDSFWHRGIGYLGGALGGLGGYALGSRIGRGGYNMYRGGRFWSK